MGSNTEGKNYYKSKREYYVKIKSEKVLKTDKELAQSLKVMGYQTKYAEPLLLLVRTILRSVYKSDKEVKYRLIDGVMVPVYEDGDKIILRLKRDFDKNPNAEFEITVDGKKFTVSRKRKRKI